VAEAHWLEVSLSVNGELAEAVAEVLDRFVSNGAVLESGVAYTNADDDGAAAGPVRVYGYLPLDEHIEENRQKLVEALWHLGQIQALPEPAFREIQDENWMASWKEHYHPIPIGKRLLILPIWIEPAELDRLAVRIDPSMAFGTGTHPSTQLCMEMVEKYTQPGRPVIDVGCGSGILSIGALKLGASRALAVDIDPASVKSTGENAGSNAVSDQLETGLGSVSEILQGRFSFQQAPLELANILANVIIRLFDDGLANLINDDGVLVLSGVLDEQAGRVEEAAQLHGLRRVETLQSGDWVALAFRK